MGDAISVERIEGRNISTVFYTINHKDEIKDEIDDINDGMG